MDKALITSLQKELIEKQRKIEQQNHEIQKLKIELNALLSEIYWSTPKNERNAGRRSIITTQLKEDVHKLKNEGKPIKLIANDLKISAGTVHKILHLPTK